MTISTGVKGDTFAAGVSISAVIPLYNFHPCIELMLEGLISQTRPPNEIILIDDGSSDDVMEYCFDKIRANLPLVKVLKIFLDRKGPGWARHKGVLAATSSHVAFLDSDDVWPRMHLEQRAIKLAEGYDLVCGPYIYSTMNNRSSSKRKPVSGLIRLTNLLQANPIGNSTVVCCRRNLILAGGYSTLPKRNDYSTWIRLARLNCSLFCDLKSDDVVIYRRSASLSSRKPALFLHNMAVFRENGFSIAASAFFTFLNILNYLLKAGGRLSH